MNEEHAPEATQGSNVAFLTGLFAGAAIGTGLGLLFAPRAGSELRGQIADSAAAAGDAVSKTVDGLTERRRDLYERVRNVASRAEDKIDRVTDEVVKTIDGGLDKAEQGLAAATDIAARSRRADRHAADRI